MLVSTATSGRTARVMGSISPKPLIPISMTASRVSSVSPKRVRGIPISLFWLPSVLRILPKGERAA